MPSFNTVLVCLMITLMGLAFAYMGMTDLAGVALGGVVGVVSQEKIN